MKYTLKLIHLFLFTISNVATRKFSVTLEACTLFLLDSTGLASSGHSCTALCLLSHGRASCPSDQSKEVRNLPRVTPPTLLCFPQHLLHVSAKALRTWAPTFLPCLLDCEPMRVRHSISGAPVRKQ